MKYPFKKQNYKKRTEYRNILNFFIFESQPEEWGKCGWNDFSEFIKWKTIFRSIYGKGNGAGNADRCLVIIAMKDKLTQLENIELYNQIEKWEKNNPVC